MKRMGRNVTLYYMGGMSSGWKERLREESIRTIPSGVASSPGQLRQLMVVLNELRGYDRIIVHHHVEPILAFYLSRYFGPRVVWYSGSVFELAWEHLITGVDYRRISPTVRRTGRDFYGGLMSDLLLSDNLYPWTVRIARMLDAETIRGFGLILANSIFLAKFLKRVYHLQESPAVVYPGPDPLLQELSSIDYQQEKDYMLAVGSLIPLKNIEAMIRAAAGVRSSKIVLVGDGQEKSNLKRLASQLNIPVEFRGTEGGEEGLARVYRECSFLVNSSLYEPFGLTPVEAALFGKTSIVTSQGGPPEVVVDGVTGYVVDPRNHLGIRSKMSTLLGDEQLRRQMGRKARENVLRRFTIEASTRRFLEEVER